MLNKHEVSRIKAYLKADVSDYLEYAKMYFFLTLACSLIMLILRGAKELISEVYAPFQAQKMIKVIHSFLTWEDIYTLMMVGVGLGALVSLICCIANLVFALYKRIQTSEGIN